MIRQVAILMRSDNGSYRPSADRVVLIPETLETTDQQKEWLSAVCGTEFHVWQINILETT